MTWFYGFVFLAVVAGFLIYDYYSSYRPKKLKPKKLERDKDPISLKDVLWIGTPEREYYEETGTVLRAEQFFCKHTETNEIYVIETKCDMLLGCFGPIDIEQMEEGHLGIEGYYPCQPHRNDWIRANEDKLVIVRLCDRGGLK
jgi:hypothetical protein